jgi:hypothetical protein
MVSLLPVIEIQPVRFRNLHETSGSSSPAGVALS